MDQALIRALASGILTSVTGLPLSRIGVHGCIPMRTNESRGFPYRARTPRYRFAGVGGIDRLSPTAVGFVPPDVQDKATELARNLSGDCVVMDTAGSQTSKARPVSLGSSRRSRQCDVAGLQVAVVAIRRFARRTGSSRLLRPGMRLVRSLDDADEAADHHRAATAGRPSASHGGP